MQAYSYDRETGIFIGTTIAHENPRRPKNYLIPAQATLKEPPVITNPSKVAKYDGNNWLIIDKPIKPLTEEEKAEEEFKKNYVKPDPVQLLRNKRDRLLAEVDWYVIRAVSTNTEVPEIVKNYMQQLRDLPSNSNPQLKEINPFYHVLDETSVNWPVLNI